MTGVHPAEEEVFGLLRARFAGFFLSRELLHMHLIAPGLQYSYGLLIPNHPHK